MASLDHTLGSLIFYANSVAFSTSLRLLISTSMAFYELPNLTNTA